MKETFDAIERGGILLETKGVWQGLLNIEEGTPGKIQVGDFAINSILYFLNGKRVIIVIKLDEEEQAVSGEFSADGKLEYDHKKKEFLFAKYPLVDVLESFAGKKIILQIELDQSVLSTRI